MGETISVTCNVEAFPTAVTKFGWVYNDTTTTFTDGTIDTKHDDQASSTISYTVE